MEKCLLLGNGGREAVLAEYISKGYELYTICPYENPTIIQYVKVSNGKYLIADPFNKKIVEDFIKQNKIEACVISSDNLLQEGLIDVAKSLGLKTFGPTSKGSKIEWSKTYALDIVEKLAPEMIIKNFNITNINELKLIIDKYQDDNFVVKPEGLTGGKGVKVGGIHFKGKLEGFEYAKTCLESSGNVIIQDKIEGREFTVMALTDGENIVITPTTFDYPYRFDKDKGPGTGGMGCLSFENGLLPFLDQNDIDQCAKLIKDTIKYVNKDSIEFRGVIYGGFFKTKNGIKFIEFNARFGDPEALNVLNLLETPFTDVMKNVFSKTLNSNNCKFKTTYTFTVYVVTKEYAVTNREKPLIFIINKEQIEKQGVKIYFANAKKIGENTYSSISNSRLFGLTTSAQTLEEAKEKLYNAIKGNIDEQLDYRTDIGNIYEH
ncbi:MAG: phosphoribosylglycinamide synthetase C domain-containing protein [Clostridia bacterium]|nr:phosphoribosylglycinamide synthetase C domain-containing protein [Clostridia bacterium]